MTNLPSDDLHQALNSWTPPAPSADFQARLLNIPNQAQQPAPQVVLFFAHPVWKAAACVMLLVTGLLVGMQTADLSTDIDSASMYLYEEGDGLWDA